MPHSLKRYQALARELAEAIQNGSLRAGDRLPSVRQLSSSRKLSASTVFQAYYQLEAQGLIRARERSGYYVASSGQASTTPEPQLPLASVGVGPAVTPSVTDLVLEVLGSSSERDGVALGSAFPHPALFPAAKLARAMSSSVTRLDPWAAVDDLTPGNLQLRRQIALRYLADGIKVHADEIVITNGGLEALTLCLAAVTRPGGKVLVESPCFYGALQALERAGLQAIEVATHPREGMELDALEEALQTHRPQACWLMTHAQNPLGCSMPDNKKRDLVTLLQQHAVPLIEDDVYGELYYDEARPLPARAFDEQGMVLHCGSFSKCLAPGYRIGWAIPGRYREAVIRQKLATSLATAVPTQNALASYLEKGGYDRHLRRLRHGLSLQQTAYAQAVARHFPAATRMTRPNGGYFMWVELPAAVDSLRLYQAARALRISLAPGPMFSASGGFRHHLRLNYGHPWSERVEQAMARLGRLVAEAA